MYLKTSLMTNTTYHMPPLTELQTIWQESYASLKYLSLDLAQNCCIYCSTTVYFIQSNIQIYICFGFKIIQGESSMALSLNPFNDDDDIYEWSQASQMLVSRHNDQTWSLNKCTIHTVTVSFCTFLQFIIHKHVWNAKMLV